MCVYCKDEQTIIEKEFIDDWIIQWCKTIDREEVNYSNYIIFIDREYLRFALEDDCECMDHGQKIKINYCPFCGDKVIGI